MKRRLTTALTLILLLLTVALAGCGDTADDVKQNPTSTPRPSATPQPIPDGWTLHTTEQFEIALPGEWMAIEMTEDAIDALIESAKSTMPELVTTMQMVKYQESIKFMAIDPDILSGYAANIMVGTETKLISSLDKYAELLKRQFSAFGYSMEIGDTFTLNDAECIKYTNRLSMPASGGISLQVEQHGVVIDTASKRYLINLTCPSAQSFKFAEMFDQVILTFRGPPTGSVPTSTPTLTSTEQVSDKEDLNTLKQQLDDIESQVSEIRGLEPKAEVDCYFVSAGELPDKLFNSLQRVLTEAKAKVDQELYVMMDLITDDIDLYDIIKDLYSEQVMGFYDYVLDKLFVASDGNDLSSLEKVVFAHEYTHALQDQHFNLNSLLLQNVDNSDCTLAALCLAEGDATLVQSSFLEDIDVADIEDLEDTNYESAPKFIQDELMLPYRSGTFFVMALDGWTAVDDAYLDPPQSTEQILHPEKYRIRDEPQSVNMPSLERALGEEWYLKATDVLGEFGLRCYLETYVESADAASAAAGWDGDCYAYLKNTDGGQVLVIRSVWDDEDESQEFFDAYLSYVDNKSNGAWNLQHNYDGKRQWDAAGKSVYLGKTGNEVLIVLAPDETTCTQVLKVFPNFYLVPHPAS